MKKPNPIYASPFPAIYGVCKKALPFLTVLLISMLVMTSRSMAQDKISVSGIQKDSSKAAWHTLKTVGSVTISYQYVDCGPIEYVNFKIDNASSDKVSVSWKYKKYNNGTEIVLTADYANVNYTVGGNSSLTGACYSENTQLGVFVRESGLILTVTDIELTEVNVSAAQ